MKRSDNQILVSLSKLVPTRRNVRRVKPEREAHRRLVASIRAHGLLEPLVVRPMEGDGKRFIVIAGGRRLAALREVYRGAKADPAIACQVRAVDDLTADALSLAENFVREAMHPLDEAEAFARLAREEAKGVEAIAAEFGVGQPYVRQRMKLAILAGPVKVAYRQGQIDTGTAEAFASVPEERQVEVWQEVGGNPQHAQHVRNVIAHAWIEAEHALFDLAKLPEGTVSRDLFADKVLVERRAFLDAQADALAVERQKLLEGGWSEVVVGPQADVQDRLWSMGEAPVEHDKETARQLAKFEKEWEKLEAKIAGIEDGDEEAIEAHEEKRRALEAERERIEREAPRRYAEATKAVGTTFLILDPDGRVRRECRIPRTRTGASGNGNGHGGVGVGEAETPRPPTADDLAERQLATTFTHQALAVREALLQDASARRRVLALILHDKVRSEALAIRHDANGTTVHAEHAEGFASAAFDAVNKRRAKVDPLQGQHHADDVAAYEALAGMSAAKMDELIDVLTVNCLTAHLQRRTELVWRLAQELKVDVRKYWRPDELWLAGYQKIQLAALMQELRGPAYGLAAEGRKKSELVADLAKLFADAAEGRIPDMKLAAKLNAWLPANLREPPHPESDKKASAA